MKSSFTWLAVVWVGLPLCLGVRYLVTASQVYANEDRATRLVRYVLHFSRQDLHGMGQHIDNCLERFDRARGAAGKIED